jgi:7,8-didemethyl-8-hydroxy-5-deazariboflavin synthase CofH subunit
MVAGFGGEVQRIVARAVTSGYLPTAADGAVLLRARGREQRFILQAADELRRNIVGDRVTYVVNRNINFTNACRLKCKFCAFSRTGIDDEAYFLPTEEVVKRAQEAYSYGATEVCLQAGIAPKLNPSFYVDLAKAVKSAVPDIHLHAYSPEEVLYGAANSQSTVRNHIRSLKEAGVGSLPGTSAEILDDAIRRRIGRKLTAQQWREIISTAHEEGLKTTCTVMYGHIESAEHISAHMSLLREIQLDTGGFTEMVPLSFVPHESPMFREGLLPDCRAGPTGAEVLSVHAVARIMLQDRIPNVQASWVKEGLRMAQVLLDAGANDLGGVLMNESISTSAGASHGQLVRPYQLREVISDIGRVPMERTTLYSEPKSLSNERAKRLRGLDNLQDGERESVFGSFSNLVKSSDHRYKPLMKVQSRRRFSNTTFHLDRKSITFSPSYTLVPTYECFNECRYCNFRKAPRTSPWLDVAEARHILELQRKTGVKEILVMSGEVGEPLDFGEKIFLKKPLLPYADAHFAFCVQNRCTRARVVDQPGSSVWWHCVNKPLPQASIR